LRPAAAQAAVVSYSFLGSVSAATIQGVTVTTVRRRSRALRAGQDKRCLRGSCFRTSENEDADMEQEVQDQTATVIDVEDLMARCLGNVEFAERILVMLQELGDENLARLERALAAEDAEAIAQLAHHLKGASANASAFALRAQAAKIEHAARRCSLGEMPSRLENLRYEWSRFNSAAPFVDLLPPSTA
jgi:HPt (histidine-containing phosphotransfer) domain-containing protein